MENLTLLYVGLFTISIGSVLGYFVRQTIAKKQADSAEVKVKRILDEAKTKAKENLLAAKNKAVEILEEVKKEERSRQNQIIDKEKRLERRDENLDQKLKRLETQEMLLGEKIKKVKRLKNELDELKEQEQTILEEKAKLSPEQAHQELLKIAEEEHQEELLKKLEYLEGEGKEGLERKAQDIMTLAMQKYASSQTQEITTTTVGLTSDELKGRIIGREGRNIRTLEKLTGAEIIVDDTPEVIVISGFNPIRRQLAKLALEKLMVDGRIHPARIEEKVEEAKKEIAQKIKEAGVAAVYDVGIAGLDSKLVQLLGRLRFRTSYGQNALLHSIEVAHLAGALASELGADSALAKKAGLLHDIGKAVDHEIQGTHVEIGKTILKKFAITEEVIKAMQSHHEDYPFESLESIIIQVADAISASRPGARKDTLEAYLKRLGELEKVANSFEGVEKSYAIQAGREIRVFVTPESVNDLGAIKLAKNIARKAEEELKYPGEIKVNVIRETRAVDYAR